MNERSFSVKSYRLLPGKPVANRSRNLGAELESEYCGFGARQAKRLPYNG
jgi:hypothetical protein